MPSATRATRWSAAAKISRHASEKNVEHARECVHVAIGDGSRPAYVEVLPDEGGVTTTQLLWRGRAWFRRHGILVRRSCTVSAADLQEVVRKLSAPVTGQSDGQGQSKRADPETRPLTF
jgi:hypothetical protein